MYVKAIELVSGFTRPIHSIIRYANQQKIIPGSATLFFVNEKGTAITCKHVAELIIAADQINKVYELQKKNGFGPRPHNYQVQGNPSSPVLPQPIIQIKNSFVNCFDTISGFNCLMHPLYDLAILQFSGFNKVLYNGHARFMNDYTQIRQGKSLCRLGYPFPEFNNFRYNAEEDDIEWTQTGITASPSFPIDGIITRLIARNQTAAGIEMSSPGLRGQSGGPLFDAEGIVYGMQSATAHLHLGFDLADFAVQDGGNIKKVTNAPFLHVGQCVHVDIIKDFLRLHEITFYES
jgi:hypothetical protein